VVGAAAVTDVQRLSSRRDALRLLGIGTGAVVGGTVFGASLLGKVAQALIDPTDIASFPGQVGAINPYTSARGTPGWQFYAYAGTPRDD
jgi:hypothetical protein